MELIAPLRRLKHSLSKMLTGPSPLLDPFEAYQLWATNYDNVDDNALLYIERRSLQPILERSSLREKDVLDAGCGTGRYLRFLQDFHPRTITATDFSPNMIEHAKEKIDGSVPVSLHVTKVEELPFADSSFDLILCTLVLGHVQNLLSAVSQLSRVLRAGGTMVISDFHPFGQLLGWQRTFQSTTGNRSRSFAVQYYTHLYSEYVDAFKRTGLELLHIEEPTIDSTLIPFYERTGRMDIYDRSKGYPMLLVFEVRKK